MAVAYLNGIGCDANSLTFLGRSINPPFRNSSEDDHPVYYDDRDWLPSMGVSKPVDAVAFWHRFSAP